MDEKQVLKTMMNWGVPSDVLFHALRARRIMRDPGDFLSRRLQARKINSSYTDLINKEKGYRFFGPDTFPGIMDAVNAARRIFEAKSLNLSDAKKTFFFNVLEASDLNENSELLALARSQPLNVAAAGYLDTVPDLNGMGVFYSPANTSTEKSQQYHTDDIDSRQVKCFINVNGVGPDNGPVTFIPADISDSVRRKLGHHWRGRRLQDEEVFAHCKQEDAISLVGEPGSGVLVDTSRCLHFGSRCRTGYRLVIMYQYTRRPNVAWEAEDGRTGRTLIIDH